MMQVGERTKTPRTRNGNKFSGFFIYNGGVMEGLDMENCNGNWL